MSPQIIGWWAALVRSWSIRWSDVLGWPGWHLPPTAASVNATSTQPAAAARWHHRQWWHGNDRVELRELGVRVGDGEGERGWRYV